MRLSPGGPALRGNCRRARACGVTIVSAEQSKALPHKAWLLFRPQRIDLSMMVVSARCRCRCCCRFGVRGLRFAAGVGEALHLAVATSGLHHPPRVTYTRSVSRHQSGAAEPGFAMCLVTPGDKHKTRFQKKKRKKKKKKSYKKGQHG